MDLVKGTSVVGRVGPCELVLEDDSVSRRHAEIYKMGSAISVRDLGSANGTFVNGERVSEAPLTPGDTVRFGVVEFSYSGPVSENSLDDQSPAAKKKRALLIGGGVAAGLLVLTGVAVIAGPGDRPGEVYGAPSSMDEPAPQVDPMRLLGQCRGYADRDSELNDWAKADEVCGKVVELDPTLTDGRTLQRLAKRELQNKNLYEQARLKMSAAQDEAGIALLVDIEKDSSYFIRARKEFNEVSERIEKRQYASCMTSMKLNLVAQAYEECKRSAEMVCNTERGVPERLRDTLKKLAAKTGKPAEVACPKEFAVFQATTTLKLVGLDPVAEIRKMYSEPEVQRVMVEYFERGRPKQAAERLKQFRVKQRKKYGTTLDDYILYFDLLEGRYASGQAGLIRGKPELVMQFWAEAFEADAKLMPAGVTSALVEEMASQMSGLYYKAAEAELQKGRMKDCFVHLYEGYKIDKKNTKIIQALKQLEGYARTQLDSGTCEGFHEALGVTLPDSTFHKRAEEAIANQNC